MNVEQMLQMLGIESESNVVTVAPKKGMDGKLYYQTTDGVHTFTANSVKRYVQENLVTVTKEGENFVFTPADGVRLVKVDADGFSGFTAKGSTKVSDLKFA